VQGRFALGQEFAALSGLHEVPCPETPECSTSRVPSGLI